MADQDWSFWRAQLAGENPALEKPLGVPEWGFYLLRRRHRWQDVRGGHCWRVKVRYYPVAIWQDEAGWHCLITYSDKTTHLTDALAIDEDIFSICCRVPLEHEEYLVKVKEIEDGRTGSDRREVQQAD